MMLRTVFEKAIFQHVPLGFTVARACVVLLAMLGGFAWPGALVLVVVFAATAMLAIDATAQHVNHSRNLFRKLEDVFAHEFTKLFLKPVPERGTVALDIMDFAKEYAEIYSRTTSKTLPVEQTALDILLDSAELCRRYAGTPRSGSSQSKS